MPLDRGKESQGAKGGKDWYWESPTVGLGGKVKRSTEKPGRNEDRERTIFLTRCLGDKQGMSHHR